MFLSQLFVKGLGHASYVVGDAEAGLAAVVDPRRDVDAYLALAEEEGLEIAEILETHVHNDYVSGAEELRQRTGAVVRASASAGLSRPHGPIRDADEFRVGALRFKVVATPGHTPEHVSFLVADTTRSDDDWVLFSGGALLVGTAARPDLLGGPEDARRAAATQFRALRDRIATLPDWIELYPTHGAGSLCGAGIGGKRWSTIGYERRNNPALRQPDVDAFVRFILTDQPAIPAYWRRMRSLNQRGAEPLAALERPRPLSAAELDHLASHDVAVVDARPPESFAVGHVPGSFGIGLEASFGTWVGSVVPADRAIALVLDDPRDLEEALVQLRRAGYDRVAGYLDGGMRAWFDAGLPAQTLRTWRPDEAAHAIHDARVTALDVRQPAEFREGHVPGARLVPGAELPTRLADVPQGPLVVVCGGGYRSTIAASLLAREGWVDVGTLAGGTDAYQAAGLPLAVELTERNVLPAEGGRIAQEVS